MLAFRRRALSRLRGVWGAGTRLHLAALGVWTVLGVPSVLWWKDSVPWVVLMSWYAIVVSHWGAYQAKRAELAVTEADQSI